MTRTDALSLSRAWHSGLSGPLQVVWFKRDLRSVDHAPLVEAARRGPVLPLYIVEPRLWAQPDRSARQWAATREALVELRAALAALGQPLVLRRGEAVAVFRALHARVGVFTLWAHEETGSDWTFQRDRAVRGWCREAGVAFTELPQFGVIRGLRRRAGWAAAWDDLMGRPPLPAPEGLPPLAGLEPGPIPNAMIWASRRTEPAPARRAAVPRLSTTWKAS